MTEHADEPAQRHRRALEPGRANSQRAMHGGEERGRHERQCRDDERERPDHEREEDWPAAPGDAEQQHAPPTATSRRANVDPAWRAEFR
jgi:hypothetical protein